MTRSATPPNPADTNASMSAVGYLVAAGALLLLFPLLPFVAALWLIDRLRGGDERTAR